ncbi:hypothetical protein RND71_014172 [Anisodus tanguticus]|uniref:Uncharacterized protein n=1 Tax=Anisodus tanguticus TaxID=243964 RepID=A0AAE1VEU6_9SOLA|nr:hypothetical protein RND71_014172 [Anisodus tanguticus]
MFILSGDYSLFPKARLLQKISSLAQLLSQILDHAFSFVDPLKFLIQLKAYESFSQKDRAYLILVQSSYEPKSFAEASNHSYWRDVIHEEIIAQEKK